MGISHKIRFKDWIMNTSLLWRLREKSDSKWLLVTIATGMHVDTVNAMLTNNLGINSRLTRN